MPVCVSPNTHFESQLARYISQSLSQLASQLGRYFPKPKHKEHFGLSTNGVFLTVLYSQLEKEQLISWLAKDWYLFLLLLCCSGSTSGCSKTRLKLWLQHLSCHVKAIKISSSKHGIHPIEYVRAHFNDTANINKNFKTIVYSQLAISSRLAIPSMAWPWIVVAAFRSVLPVITLAVECYLTLPPHIISVQVKSRSMLHHGSVGASLKQNKRNLKKPNPKPNS